MLALIASLAVAGPVDDVIAASEGKPVAVVVAKGSWCPVCVAELRRLNARMDEAAGTVLGVITESRSAARALERSHDLALPILSDTDGTWVMEHGFSVPAAGHPMPGVQFFDRCGRPAGQILGRRPGSNHTQQILDRLRQLASSSDCQRVQV